MARPKLFCGRSDRLIARLKMVLYAWRFIDQVDGQLFVLWSNLPARYAEEDVDYSPSMIFDLVNFYAAGGSDRIQFIESSQRAPDGSVALDGPEFADEARTGFDRAMFADGVFYQSGSPQFRFSDEPPTAAYMTDGVQRLFRSLPVHPQIEAARTAFYQRHDLTPGSFDTVHVRRGDVYEMIRTELPGWSSGALTSSRLDILIGHFVARTAPLDFYRTAIEAAIARGRRIVFTSDSPEVITDFRKAFGRDLFINLSTARMRVPIQKAFLDFLVLADSAHIVGTSSNFSAMPAELAGVPLYNIAGAGDFSTVEAAFREAFLEGVDSAEQSGADEALRRLEMAYDEFAKRRSASTRARNLRADGSVAPAATDRQLEPGPGAA